jgi:hypothetical protein
VQQVAAFYRTHASGQVVAGILLVLSAFSFLTFAGVVRMAVQRADGESVGSTLGLAGAVLFSVGLTIVAGLGAALGDGPGRMDPLTIQTLNVLFNDVFAPLAVGIAGFSIGNGIAIVMSRALPAWVGWLGIAIGVISLTPAGIIGFLGLGVWILIVGVQLAARGQLFPVFVGASVQGRGLRLAVAISSVREEIASLPKT